MAYIRREAWYLESSIHRLLFVSEEAYLTVIYNSDNTVDFTLTRKLDDNSSFEDTIRLVNSTNFNRQTNRWLLYTHIRSGKANLLLVNSPLASMGYMTDSSKLSQHGPSVNISQMQQPSLLLSYHHGKSTKGGPHKKECKHKARQVRVPDLIDFRLLDV